MAKKAKATEKVNKIRALVEASAPKVQELTYGEGDNELKFIVNPIISLQDRSEMIRGIVDFVFVADQGGEDQTILDMTIGSYSPEYLKIAQRYMTVRYFTNLELPKSIDETWLLLCHTSIYEDIKGIVGDELNSIFSDANDIIKANVEYLANKTDINSLIGNISKRVGEISHKFSDGDITKLMDVIGKLSSVTPEAIIGEITKASQALLNTEAKNNN